MDFNYQKICSDLLEDLPERTKGVISHRFGLLSVEESPGAKSPKRKTLQAIGKDYGITRERVRQIQNDGFLKLRDKKKKYQKTFQYFTNYLKEQGGLQKESGLLPKLGGEKFKSHIFFLLTIGDQFDRTSGTKEFYPLWLIHRDYLASAQKTIDYFYKVLEKAGQPLTQKELLDKGKGNSSNLSYAALISYLQASKKIKQNAEGLYGLSDWPEINPRGIKDKAYLVFKKENKPLHFREATSLISDLFPQEALSQTVHNELIRDSRFVLVGRGLYALKEWGYTPGVVKDIIFRILGESKEPLARKEIVEKVLEQRFVKENTILVNLQNKEYFFKTPDKRYTIREA